MKPRYSSALNGLRRAEELERLAAGEQVDVLVVGGGITGVGVALDAASRGLSVALLERRDLANGTSRFSSKLVHGGLRYLAHGDVGLAWESARERGLLLETIAPHLVRPLPILVPLHPELPRKTAAFIEAGIRAGDAMRAVTRTSRRALPPPRRISAGEALRLAPALRTDGLRGALLYWDGQLEDDARLVVAVARTAALHGARVLTYCSALELTAEGATARDERTGETLAIAARHVVNATGVWAGELEPSVSLRPSRGSHLLVRAALLGEPRAAVNVPVPGERGRWVFAIPLADDLVLIGLTDEAFDEPVRDEPPVGAGETQYLLANMSRALGIDVSEADVIGRFAGLRPLLAVPGRATSDLSRRHAVVEHPESGVLTVVGGKLTTYRRMAQDVVDRIAAREGASRCRTRRLPLVGAASPAQLAALDAPARLVRRYGAEAVAVAALADRRPELLEPLGDGLPALGVEIVFGVEHELALTAEDLVDRRTRLGLVEAARPRALAAVDVVADLGGAAAVVATG